MLKISGGKVLPAALTHSNTVTFSWFPRQMAGTDFSPKRS